MVFVKTKGRINDFSSDNITESTAHFLYAIFSILTDNYFMKYKESLFIFIYESFNVIKKFNSKVPGYFKIKFNSHAIGNFHLINGCKMSLTIITESHAADPENMVPHKIDFKAVRPEEAMPTT